MYPISKNYASLACSVSLILGSTTVLVGAEPLWRKLQTAQALSTNDPAKAAGLYLDFGRAHPQHSRAATVMADAIFLLHAAGELRRVVEDGELVLTNNRPALTNGQRRAALRLLIMRSYLKLGTEGKQTNQIEKVLSHYDQLKNESPAALDEAVFVADAAYDALDRRSTAAAMLDEWIRSNPNHARRSDAQYRAARHHYLQGQYADVIRVLNPWLDNLEDKTRPLVVEALKMRSYSRAQTGDWEGAAADLEESTGGAVESDDWRKARQIRIEGLARQGEEKLNAKDYGGGIALLRKALDLRPVLAVAQRMRLALARAELNRNRPDAALVILREVQAEPTQEPVVQTHALRLMAEAHETDKNWREAIRAWVELAKIDPPTRARSLVQAANGAIQVEDWNLARHYLHDARAAGLEELHEVELLTGQIDYQMKAYSEAEKRFLAAAALPAWADDPRRAWAMFMAADSQERQYRRAEAAKSYQAAATLPAANPDLQMRGLQHAVRLLMEVNDAKGARVVLAKLVAAFPNENVTKEAIRWLE